jgi:hypothetical protein
MEENASSAEKKPIKTYISENNQNKITSTLTLEDGKLVQRPDSQLNSSTQIIPEVKDIQQAGQAQNESASEEEPELLNAPTIAAAAHTDGTEEAGIVWPPTSAVADAEAAAGLPIGSLTGQEGEGENNA